LSGGETITIIFNIIGAFIVFYTIKKIKQ
jgi:hypothetical protein